MSEFTSVERKAIAASVRRSSGVGGFHCSSRRGDVLCGQGSKLVALDDPALGELNGAFVEVPVDVEVNYTGDGAVGAVLVGEVPAEHVAEATSFVGRLVRQGKLSVGAVLAPGATHTVEVDGEGRRVVVRKRFA